MVSHIKILQTVFEKGKKGKKEKEKKEKINLMKSECCPSIR
jgi:hypothetical protein